MVSDETMIDLGEWIYTHFGGSNGSHAFDTPDEREDEIRALLPDGAIVHLTGVIRSTQGQSALDVGVANGETGRVRVTEGGNAAPWLACGFCGERCWDEENRDRRERERPVGNPCITLAAHIAESSAERDERPEIRRAIAEEREACVLICQAPVARDLVVKRLSESDLPSGPYEHLDDVINAVAPVVVSIVERVLTEIAEEMLDRQLSDPRRR